MRKAVLALLLLWSVAAFLVEVNDALERYDHQVLDHAHPAGWRFDMPPARELESCLAEIGKRTPAGSMILILGPENDDQGAQFFRWRWASYLLPTHHIVTLNNPQVVQRAQYLLAYGGREARHPRLGPGQALRKDCVLHGVRPPSGSGSGSGS